MHVFADTVTAMAGLVHVHRGITRSLEASHFLVIASLET